MRLDIPHNIKQKNGLLLTSAMHIYIQLNQMINETKSLLLQSHSVYNVVVEDIYLHYNSSLSLYWMLLMQFVFEYSRQIGFYKMIHYQVMIWWIEIMIKYWELEVQIQTFMKGHFCYTNCDNAEVTLRNSVVVVPVSTQTHQPCIHKY